MNTHYDNDIDYEHMDDLPLSKHIEWSRHPREDIITADFDFDSEDWYTRHRHKTTASESDNTESNVH